MFYYEGQSCPVCGKAFEETDDIVSCPECGAPHHRECWKAEGHCHFADRHGTAEQWTRPETGADQQSSSAEQQPEEEPTAKETTAKETEGRRCPHCGKNNPTYSEFCSRCGRPLVEQDWTPPPYRNPGAAYTPFHAHAADHTGSVPRDMLLDDGVTAREAAMVVGTNQMYYLPRFEKMRNAGKTVSWNWVAFFFPAPWLFYRKNYLAGALVLALQVIAAVFLSLLIQPYLLQSETLMDAFAAGSITATQYMAQYNALSAEYLMVPSVLLLSTLQLAINVIMGLFGNYIYRCAVMNRCRKLKEDYPSDYEARLPIEGGVTAGLFFMALLLGEFLPSVLLMFFQ